MEIIDEVIQKSWYKFNPKLTLVCYQVIKKMDKSKIENKGHGFNRCWLFMQILHAIQQDIKLGLPYYWFKDGVVVDPETLMLITHGRIIFKWELDCRGCQIEKECPCQGNPNNNAYASIEERLKLLTKSPSPTQKSVLGCSQAVNFP